VNGPTGEGEGRILGKVSHCPTPKGKSEVVLYRAKREKKKKGIKQESHTSGMTNDQRQRREGRLHKGL